MDSKVTLILQEKIVKFELGHQRKVLDEYSLTLEFFLVKYVHISFFLIDITFSNLIKKKFKKLKFRKGQKNS